MLWFSRKKKIKETQFTEDDIIKFSDMLQQPISLSVKKDGNDDVFRIFSQTKTNTSEFLLDKDQCIVLSEVLKDYAVNGNLNKTKTLFLEEQ